MRRLTLLRHAKSSWEDPEVDDFDRPLNPRGLRNIPDMGRRLARQEDRPEVIVASPALRALATARGIGREIGYRDDRILQVPALYMAAPATILQVVQGLDDARRHAMIVGHNPGLTDFANSLGEIRIDNMPTTSMLCVEFPQARWSQIRPETAEFNYFDFPKKRPG